MKDFNPSPDLFGAGLALLTGLFNGQSSVNTFRQHEFKFFKEILPKLKQIQDHSQRLTEISKHAEYFRLLYDVSFEQSNRTKNSYEGNKLGLEAFIGNPEEDKVGFIDAFKAYVEDLSKHYIIKKTTKQYQYPRGFVVGSEFNGNHLGSYVEYEVVGKKMSSQGDNTTSQKKSTPGDKTSIEKTAKQYQNLFGFGALALLGLSMIKKN